MRQRCKVVRNNLRQHNNLHNLKNLLRIFCAYTVGNADGYDRRT